MTIAADARQLRGDSARIRAHRMRSAVLEAAGRFAIRDVSLTEPGPGEVRVRMEGSGVCASSLPLFEGREWFEYPREAGAPGHEGWGVIDAVGDGVDTTRVGDRVAALSYHAFAECDVMPATHVVPLPDALANADVPGEALGCAMNVFARSAIEPGMTVAVVGIGYLGALLVQLASQAGARVIALSRRTWALEVARSCGADEVVPTGDAHAATARVATLTDGLLCDRAIECVGRQDTLDLSSALVRERGRLVIAGFHQDGPRQVDMFQWNWRGLDVVNAHERDPMAYVAGIRAAVEAMVSARLQPAPLHTHRVTLDDIGTAFELMRDRPDGFLRALVIP